MYSYQSRLKLLKEIPIERMSPLFRLKRDYPEVFKKITDEDKVYVQFGINPDGTGSC